MTMEELNPIPPVPRYSQEEYKVAQDSISSSVPSMGRNVREYLLQLGIRREDLEGKQVLDLGAGSNLALERGLPKEGIHAHVISCSPAFKEGKVWTEHGTREPIDSKNVVAAMAEELPFSDNTFDTVVMFYVTIYFNRDERMRDALTEIVRVLKPGGVAYIGPLLLNVNTTSGGIDRNRRWLDQEKVNGYLVGKAVLEWETARDTPSGAKARTLRIVKNKE